jgi:hypothetical protein
VRNAFKCRSANAQLAEITSYFPGFRKRTPTGVNPPQNQEIQMNSTALIRRRNNWQQQGDSLRLVQQGRTIAQREGNQALASVDEIHDAEVIEANTESEALQAKAYVLAREKDELDASLEEAGFDRARHLEDIAQGKIDLTYALSLTVLNIILGLFVFLPFAPAWMAVPMALVVLVSSLPVERFFEAHEARSVIRQTLFLTFWVLSAGSVFLVGTLRGTLFKAIAPTDNGPISHFLISAAPILRTCLGVLGMVSEFLVGFLLYRVRKTLLSGTARAVCERDRRMRALMGLHAALETLKAEPELRRKYRRVGVREFLNWRIERKRYAEENHFKHAIKWAAVLLLLVGGLILGSAVAFGVPLPSRTIVPVIDLTDSVSDENFIANTKTIEQILLQLQPGDRVLIAGITGSFGETLNILDRTMPVKSGAFGFEVGAAREALLADWRSISGELLKRRKRYTETDVIGALEWISYVADPEASQVIIVVLSDLRQTRGINLERPSTIAVNQAIQRTSKLRLKGAKVFLLGIDPYGKSQAYFENLQEFWTRVLKIAGAEVLAFRIDRRLPNLREGR